MNCEAPLFLEPVKIFWLLLYFMRVISLIIHETFICTIDLLVVEIDQGRFSLKSFKPFIYRIISFFDCNWYDLTNHVFGTNTHILIH